MGEVCPVGCKTSKNEQKGEKVKVKTAGETLHEIKQVRQEYDKFSDRVKSNAKIYF